MWPIGMRRFSIDPAPIDGFLEPRRRSSGTAGRPPDDSVAASRRRRQRGEWRRRRAPRRAAPPAAAPASYFPEPKRVHTVSVRPDGTIIADEPPPPARSFVASNDPSAVSRAAVGAGSAANPNVATDMPLPVARPATPKTTARVVTTPKATAAVAGAADPGADRRLSRRPLSRSRRVRRRPRR